MNPLSIFLALITIVVAQSVSPAQERVRSIEQFSCKDVMRERGADRDVAIAFLHGFLIGKSGASKVDLQSLHKQSDAFIERCLENPAEPAVEAMIKIRN